MDRRNILKGTAISLLGFSAFSDLALAKASGISGSLGESFSDDDADYADWIPAPSTPGGQIRFKTIANPVEPDSEASCRLFRFVAGITVPRHKHPEGELTCVLAGGFLQDVLNAPAVFYKKGDLIWMPPDSIHEKSLSGEAGTTILSFTPKKLIYKI